MRCFLNPTFEKALYLLAHPFSLAALGLLMLNDHLFRRFWPSWLTGKLSDFAWLSFAPFLAAAFLAWLPWRERARGRWVGALSFGGIGLVFALGKAVPAVHALVLDALRPLLAAPSIVLDPTDLIALPVLAVGYYLWRITPPPADRQRGRTRAGWGLAAVPFAVMLTVANSAAPNYGITCLSQDGPVLTAGGQYNSFTSSDGGLTWQVGTAGQSGGACDPYGSSGAYGVQTLETSQSGLVFRYQSGEDIEISGDGGASFTRAQDIQPMSQALRYYLTRTQSGNPFFRAGPLAAVEDEATGNVVFAMGQEGALVYTRQAEWVWAPVGSYRHHAGPPGSDMIWGLLNDTVILAVELAFLVFVILAHREIWLHPLRNIKKWQSILRALGVFAALVGWVSVALILSPAVTSSYLYSLTVIGLLATGLLLIPLTIDAVIAAARRSPRLLVPLTGFGLLSAVLFLLPYFLWVYNALPLFETALLFSALLALAVLAVGMVAARPRAEPAVG